MLADRGDALGKEAKNWLKRPAGREIKVTSGTGGERVHLVGVSAFRGALWTNCEQDARDLGHLALHLLQAAQREPLCEKGQEHGRVRE